MPLNLHTSNHLEKLSEKIAHILSVPLANPFEPEVVVVQSKGMERWISLELARKHGICANIRFPFPNHFIHELMQRIVQDLPEKSAFDPKIMTWRIMSLLPECLERPSFADLKSYLTDPKAEIKQVQLSTRIADLFDQYALFRPSMILEWERGKDGHWQAELWRELIKKTENQHRAALGKTLIETLTGKSPVAELPERISVFGISALPQFHVEVLDAISQHSEVNLFLMNPCKEYWGDIVSDSEIRRASKRKKPADFNLELFHFEKGNSLLASTGKLGRDFFDLIEDFNCDVSESFVEPGQDSVLGCLQTDVLHLQDRFLRSAKKKLMEPDDDSIQFHSCHSQRREVEVLQDHLLSLFDQNPDLQPNDIIVMMPDVEPYAPYIQAAFDLPYDDPMRIPYSISDQSHARENDIIDTFFALLNLIGGRFGSSEVMGILESPAIRARFELGEDDLDLIHAWVRETRIRWGIDQFDRERMGLPAFSQNTWRSGLERMLLGYAFPVNEQELFRDILPYDKVEGSQANVLGKLAEFMELLFKMTESFSRKYTLMDWHVKLNDMLDTFFSYDNQTMYQAQTIRRSLTEMDDLEMVSGFEGEISLVEVRYHLETRLLSEGQGFGFLTGGLTFCSMLPMRSIPAKVICLIGMNGDSYPRMNQQLAFDLMAEKPMKGDRSRRSDDRYLFLEALMSAREKFYISYIGQSIKDNTAIPPSVLVIELMDYVNQNFQVQNGEIMDNIVKVHRLQAFSPEYFKPGSAYFSYSRENLEAAKILTMERKSPPSFFDAGLPEPGEEFLKVSLFDLYRFFRNPARFLLNQRLRLFLQEDIPVLEEKETFRLGGLDRYDVAQRLVQDLTSGDDIDVSRQIALASGRLSHGAVGQQEFDSLTEKVSRFVASTTAITGQKPLPPINVDIRKNQFRIVGTIEDIYPSGLMVSRFAAVRAKDQLRAWLLHLVLNEIGEAGYPKTTFLTGIDTATDGNWRAWRFGSLEANSKILERILDIYWEGMTAPIPFFPESALEYSLLLYQGNQQYFSLGKARNKWRGTRMERGESEDAYFHLTFGREKDPMDKRFQQLARDIYNPLLLNRQGLD